MPEKLDASDWGDNLDDSDSRDWGEFLAGPDDDVFEDARLARIDDSDCFEIEGTYGQNCVDLDSLDTGALIGRIAELESELRAANILSNIAFEHALKHQNLNLLREMLESGFDPDTRRHNNRTALMRAAYYNDPELAALLLEFGADPLKTDVDGDSATRTALKNDNEVERLIVKSVMEADVSWRLTCDTSSMIAPEQETDISEVPGETIWFPKLYLLIKHGFTELFKQAIVVGHDVFGVYHAPNDSQAARYECLDSSTYFRNNFRDELMSAVITYGRTEIGEILVAERARRLATPDERLSSLFPSDLETLREANNLHKVWLATEGKLPAVKAREKAIDNIYTIRDPNDPDDFFEDDPDYSPEVVAKDTNRDSWENDDDTPYSHNI